MRSLANRVCKKPDESSLSPEISNLLQDLESSVKVMKQKDEVKEKKAKEIINDDNEDFDEAVTKKQVRIGKTTPEN